MSEMAKELALAAMPIVDEHIGYWKARASAYEQALEKIAGSHWERVGYDQTDIDDVPDLDAYEAMKLARSVLSKAKPSQGKGNE